jgi:hypothetical protein
MRRDLLIGESNELLKEHGDAGLFLWHMAKQSDAKVLVAAISM